MASKVLILSLGSNLGDRLNFLFYGIREIKSRIGKIQKVSSVFETEPFGVASSHLSYFNLALMVETTLNPIEILNLTQDIEKEAGRTAKGEMMPRNLDIDILFFEKEIIALNHLVIPHPRLEIRNFVLVPLLEICPGWVHPVSNKNIAQLRDENQDTTWIKKVSHALKIS